MPSIPSDRLSLYLKRKRDLRPPGRISSEPPTATSEVDATAVCRYTARGSSEETRE
jgi:hypothetical protein